MDIVQKLSLAGLVPVIKIENALDAAPLCKALADGGLPVAEITFRTEAAEEAIRAVHQELPNVMLGAGTVLTAEQADKAQEAGAAYIVSPGINREVVRHCQRIGVPIIPGCASPSDIEIALSLGITTVKLFPAEALGGLNFMKAISAPYGNVSFLPTGGVNEANLNEYLAFPKVIACGGSWMAPTDAIAAKDWTRIQKLTRSAVRLMLGYELRHVGINSGSPKQAFKDAEALASLFDLPVMEGNSSIFTGDSFEMMKNPFRGTHGHIAIACNNLSRAKWHLENRGFVFDEASLSIKSGKPVTIYLKDEIAGFAFHLLQK